MLLVINSEAAIPGRCSPEGEQFSAAIDKKVSTAVGGSVGRRRQRRSETQKRQMVAKTHEPRGSRCRWWPNTATPTLVRFTGGGACFDCNSRSVRRMTPAPPFAIPRQCDNSSGRCFHSRKQGASRREDLRSEPPAARAQRARSKRLHRLRASALYLKRTQYRAGPLAERSAIFRKWPSNRPQPRYQVTDKSIIGVVSIGALAASKAAT